MQIKIPPFFSDIKPYQPGKPLEELERQYGITGSIKLASNENPLGPSPRAIAAIQSALTTLHRYPDASGHVLVHKIADRRGVPAEHIVLGNGSDDIIALLTQAFLHSGDEALIPSPSFLMYEIAVRSSGARPVLVPLDDHFQIDLARMAQSVGPSTRMVFLCNPNNPTGTLFDQSAFDAFADRLPVDIIVVVDEAYREFVRDPAAADCSDLIKHRRPVVSLRTFSKAYGLAGLRIGYGVMPAEMAELLNRIRQPFNVNALAQAGALAALDDAEFMRQTVATVHAGLDWLYDQLNRLGVKTFPTQSNFFLIDVERDAGDVYEQMLRRGVIVRSMAAYGYPRYIRINAGRPDENQRFVEALKQVLEL